MQRALLEVLLADLVILSIINRYSIICTRRVLLGAWAVLLGEEVMMGLFIEEVSNFVFFEIVLGLLEGEDVGDLFLDKLKDFFFLGLGGRRDFHEEAYRVFWERVIS